MQEFEDAGVSLDRLSLGIKWICIGVDARNRESWMFVGVALKLC